MSHYRNSWRTNLVNEIRRYPALKAMKDEAMEISITPDYSGLPRGGEASRMIENAVLKSKLTMQEDLIIQAVEKTIESVLLWPDGGEIVKLITMVDFTRKYRMTGAAMVLHVSDRTASTMRSRFIDAYGKRRGFQ